MKQQFRKGFRQNYKGKDYIIKVIKLSADNKIVIREEIMSGTDLKKTHTRKR